MASLNITLPLACAAADGNGKRSQSNGLVHMFTNVLQGPIRHLAISMELLIWSLFTLEDSHD